MELVIKINIPTNMREVKEWFMHLFGWLTKPGRIKKNQETLDELYNDIKSELCSDRWVCDMSGLMRRELFGVDGKIKKLIRNAKRKLV